MVWTYTVYNMEKYILPFGQICFTIGTNIFCNIEKKLKQMADNGGEERCDRRGG